jgi:hypothetical protein
MAWPTTTVTTGDLITATQLNQLPIALAVGAGAAASYDFQNIPAFWTHLMIVFAGGTASGNASDLVRIRFNNDSAANYTRQYVLGSGATASALGETNQSTSTIGRVTGNSEIRGSAQIVIPNYATSLRHPFIAQAFADVGGTLYAYTLGGLWIQTSPITRVTILPDAGSFVAGSIATLYGMGTI